jgi:predicted nucleotidyltransferase component of viral defense system
MAALKAFHWETVTPQMRQILVSIGTAAYSSRFYLAGGTALALQLGHRLSIDLDLFSETDEVLEKTRYGAFRQC